MPKTKQFDEKEVLSKAQEVFCLKGYNGTSMDDLVQATGLSRSSIYDTFVDKHGLFLRCLQQYRCDEYSDIEKAIAKTNSPKKKIRLLFEHTIQQILSDKQRKGCLLINTTMELTCMDKDVADIAHANMEELEQLFYSWVKESQASGEIAKKFPAKALSRHLYNSITGLRLTGRNRPEADTLRDIVKVALSILD
jgi:TetR/AcrR family transcriptional repressor of nem operon